MREYIVEVTFQKGEGYSYIVNCFAIMDVSMKSAKEYAKKLIPYYMDIVKVRAHKVKEGEYVPRGFYNWLYR